MLSDTFVTILIGLFDLINKHPTAFIFFSLWIATLYDIFKYKN